MKLVTYLEQGIEKVGALMPAADAVVPIPVADMNTLIETMTLDALTDTLKGGTPVPLSEVTLCAPIPRPRQDVVCLGVNYAAHALECGSIGDFSAPRETEPAIYFSKRVNRAVAPGEPVDSHPDVVKELDYEAELAVILGKDALNVAENDCE